MKDSLFSKEIQLNWLTMKIKIITIIINSNNKILKLKIYNNNKQILTFIQIIYNYKMGQIISNNKVKVMCKKLLKK